VGLVLPMFSGDPATVLRAAREGEELGFDGLFAFDHFFPPGAPADRPALEAFTTLGAVAAVTEGVTVGTLVTRASLRPAGMLAKLGAWLDHASGGRLVLGIGTGDPIDRPEHERYGIPMLDKTERRAHLEEVMEALRDLFAGKSYPGGARVPPLEGPLRPAPASPGGPPLWIGAQADPVIRVAGRLADAWNGWGLDPEAFGRKASVLAAAAAAHGRSPVPTSTWAGIVLAGRDRAETRELLERRRARGLDDEAWTGTTEDLAGFLGALADRGAAWAVLVLAGPADRRAVVAAEVLPALRAIRAP
jgi:alkanesulfonate monooxygenase SsuD/methylene tetrahydromethanopterin reductase-like flavin-dependent oxidoreductase (luciferase family)